MTILEFVNSLTKYVNVSAHISHGKLSDIPDISVSCGPIADVADSYSNISFPSGFKIRSSSTTRLCSVVLCFRIVMLNSATAPIILAFPFLILFFFFISDISTADARLFTYWEVPPGDSPSTPSHYYVTAMQFKQLTVFVLLSCKLLPNIYSCFVPKFITHIIRIGCACDYARTSSWWSWS